MKCFIEAVYKTVAHPRKLKASDALGFGASDQVNRSVLVTDFLNSIDHGVISCGAAERSHWVNADAAMPRV
jgi:hypothetical protein